MAEKSVKTVLWENIAALMRHQWGGENLNRLAREISRPGDEVSPASISRIKAAEQSTGIGMIDDIAEAFGIKTWQLLLPDLDPAQPQQLPSDPEKQRLLHAHATLREKWRRRLLETAEEYLEIQTESNKARGLASGNP